MITEQRFNRFKEASWFPEKDETVLIGGAGGIGSWLTFFLSRAGFQPIVYDYDVIEEHNLSGQLFKKSDISKYKVTALKDMLLEYCDHTISTFINPVDENSPTHYFVFSCFDNMKARKDLFNVWKKSIKDCPVTPVFIDGRLEFENLQIFCVTPSTMDLYEQEHLFDDADVEEAPCSLRQTTHTAAMIASHMTAFFTNHISNIYTRKNIRELPFKYEYFVPMNLTTEEKY